MASRSWRLLVHGPADGPWNMAVDEALMGSAAEGMPALRFYGWQGPWLSLGYAQRADAGLRSACRAAGVGIVRRATGGGAVLHGADLTYAVVAPEGWLPAGLRATYAAIASGLVAGLSVLGIDAERSPVGAAREGLARPFDCFAAAAGDEICVAGRKLVGSAQRRAGGAVLQHGSLRLTPDPPEARSASGLGAAHATSLAELGLAIEPATLRQALVAGLASTLAARFEVSDLTAPERHRASVGSRQTLDREAENTRGGSQGCPSQADT